MEKQAIGRGAALRYQKAELKRVKKERDQAQSELKEVKKIGQKVQKIMHWYLTKNC